MLNTLFASFVLAAASGETASPPKIPLVPGLTITTAIAEPDGDYESRKLLESIDASGWRLRYAADVRGADGKPESITSERLVHTEDLQSARTYRNYFESDVEEDYPGTTALGASASVLKGLRDSGVAPFAVVAEDAFLKRASANLPGENHSILALASALTASAGRSFKGELKRRNVGTMPVLVNDQLQHLPVLVASGLFTAKNGDTMQAELSFLDDDQNPLALQWRIGDTQLRVVRIEYPLAKSPLAEMLQTNKRVTLPGLYFDFGSATLRPESQAALPSIAEAIRAASTELILEGHTDNIGTAERNQALSLARAQSVWSALRALDPTLGPVPKIIGFGASRPRASNDTLEGRAQNRRVELAIP
ncbi:hypothetical protein C7S18_19675 [Ahniella affigens]|uniref:OmpA-like domain-containing protein n=1 Tax=Ahniella affigens TaxID=2021234 RepID=A0A2P1PWP0_9GAMM|nr:OmpA family protein [Ahniella affigens]AVP99246.1 hypothetical protein C7S18_19675 [Ahniella affigens]